MNEAQTKLVIAIYHWTDPITRAVFVLHHKLATDLWDAFPYNGPGCVGWGFASWGEATFACRIWQVTNREVAPLHRAECTS